MLKEYSDDEPDDEIDIPQPQDKPISHPTSLVTGVTGGGVKSPLHPEEKPKSPEKKDEKVLAKPDDSSKSVLETDKPSPKEYSDDETDDEIDIPKPQDKPLREATPSVTPFTTIPDVKARDVIAFKAEEKSTTVQTTIKLASTSITTEDTKIVKPIDSLSQLKDDKIPTSVGDKAPKESVKPMLKEYSDDETDNEIDIPKPQDKPISHPTSLVTGVTGGGVISPLHSEEKPKSPEKKDEKVLAKPDDSSKSVVETDKPSPKEYSDDETDDEIDIPKPQDKPISHPTSLVTGVTGGGVKSPLHPEEKLKSPEEERRKSP
ncbi:GM22068 [Drosophila sechellia]|uniref:GM22068 n=1 Tax=Drosophila sechellia TaxID=7238 RepID=B4IN65_DROSE|nr:GM22068 [Drosophila sechellia]